MLDELRKKPRGVKEAYAFWGAMICTALIAFVWGISVTTKFSEGELVAIPDSKTQTAGAMSQFLGQFKDNLANVWGRASQGTFDAADDEESHAAELDTLAPTSSQSVVNDSSVSDPILIGTSSPRYIEIATTTR